MKKKIKLSALLLSTVLFTCSACQKTPETEYITNKEEQVNLISNNTGYDNGIPVREQCNAPKKAEASGETLNDFTSIEVDANVYVPEQTAVPIYTVTSKDITADDIANMVQAVFPTGEYFNPDYNGSGYTTEELYNNIEEIQSYLNTVELSDAAEPVFDKETGELLEANQEYLDQLQEWIEYYKGQLELIENDSYYGDGISYEYQPQTEDLSITEDKTIVYEFETVLFQGKTGRTSTEEARLLIARDSMNEEIHYYITSTLQCGYRNGEISLIDKYKNNFDENSCDYSQEEAIDMAEEFIASLGIENMGVRYVTDVELIVPGEADRISYGRSGYRLYLYRGYGDMGDTYLRYDDTYVVNTFQNTAGTKPFAALAWLPYDSVINYYNQNEGQVEDFEVPFYREMAVVTILDDGIVDAFVLNPQAEQEQLAENVTLLEFDRVLEQGVTQLEIVYGEAGEAGFRTDIEVNRIELNYAYMQAPNNEKEYTLIPVWDFKESEAGIAYVTINAIDGTVFDRSTGY